jgi:prephenate dehydratase
MKFIESRDLDELEDLKNSDSQYVLHRTTLLNSNDNSRDKKHSLLRQLTISDIDMVQINSQSSKILTMLYLAIPKNNQDTKDHYMAPNYDNVKWVSKRSKSSNT